MVQHVALGNVATAFLAIATTYFVHYCENNNSNQYNSVTKNFCPSFITSNSNSNNFYCGENGKFCRRSRRNEFDDDEEEDAPNLFNACVHARAKVESQIFGQTESTDILLDAICDKFREIERAELEEEDLGERREDGVEEERQTPLVMSIHGSPGVGKSHFHRALARAVYGANVSERRRRRKNGGGGKAYGEMLASVARNVVTGGVRGSYYAAGRKKKTCPGELCPAYKILFGAEYVEKDRERQKRMIVSNLRAHLRRYPESVVVIEEYDKLPCEVRSVLRQLFDSGRVMQSTPSSPSSSSSLRRRRRKKRGGAFSRLWRRGSEEEEDSARSNGGDEDDEDEDGNDTFEDYDVYGEKREVLGNKAIFILEANAGFVHIHGAAEADRKRRSLSKVGDVDKNKDKNYLNSERERHHVELSRALKNAMFTKWEKEHCEDFHDTVKVLSSIEYFVPFQPLDEDALKEIANAHLEYRSNYLIENEFVSSMLTTLSSSSSSRESPTSSVASLPQMDAIKRRVNVTLSWDDRFLSFLARESEFEGELAIEGGKEVKSTLSRTVTRAIRRALLPSSTTTNEEKNGGGKTIHSSFARYEKIRDFILEDSKKKFASGDKAGAKTKDEEGKEAEDALLQINVRLAVVVNDDEEDTMQKNPETKDSSSSYSSQRRRSVVASIFLFDD